MAYYANMIYHLDLCILAYHLYGQSLVWPMDPYYEQMDFGAVGDRRKNFMAEVRNKLNGRAFSSHYANQTCRDALDPIIYNYDRMNPKQPSLYRPEVGQWLYFKPIPEIVDSIHTVYMSTIGSSDPVPISTNSINNSGTDHLYCFEGVFGLDGIQGFTNKETDGQKAMTGFILDKEVGTGLLANIGDTYDVHIIFRGSRSGKAARSIQEATPNMKLLSTSRKGNADWVSDMQMPKTKNYPEISNEGEVSIGFKLSLDTMIPCIKSCLEDIHSRRGEAPRNIYLAGHSLAGALAGQFTSAMILGDGTYLDKSKLPRWDFSKIKLRTYGCPTFGDRKFAKQWMLKNIACQRIKVNLDPITSDPIPGITHVGELIETPAAAKVKILKNHRFEVTRNSLIEYFNIAASDLPKSGSIFTTSDGGMPKNLSEVIGSVTFPLPQFNQQDLENYLEILKEALYDPSSYAPENTMSLTRDNARKDVLKGIIQDISTILIENITVPLRKRMSNLFDSDEVKFIWLCFVMLKLNQGHQVNNIQDFGTISQKV